MTKARRLTASEADGVAYRRAKTWQLALGQLNNGSAMVFYVLVGLMSYLQSAGYGIAVALAGIILTVTRVLDGLIDPLLALIIDKVQLRFGKIRFFLILGWLIRSLAVFLLFVWGSDRNLGPAYFIVMYVVYIIGSSINDIAGNMVAPVMTNDPRQRPTVQVWATTYSYLVPTIFSLISTLVILPRHGNQFSVAMLRDTAVVFVAATLVFQILAVVGISHADRPENFRHLSAKDSVDGDVSVRDMWRFLKENKPFQRYTVAAAADKLAQQVGSQAVVTTMLYGILIGNMQLGTILSVGAMLPAILFAILGARYTGKHGGRKAMITWTWVAIALSVPLIAICLLTDMRSFLVSVPLMIGFFGLYLLLNGSKMCITTAVGSMRADIIDHELDRSGKYLPAVVIATYNFIDQLVSSLGASVALGVVAFIGYSATMPQPTDTATMPILVATVVLFFGIPVLGWIVTLVVMPGYQLSREEMINVQRRIADKKADLARAESGAGTVLAV